MSNKSGRGAKTRRQDNYKQAALILSQILHGLEKRGITLTTAEDNRWMKATALIELAEGTEARTHKKEDG